MSSSHFDFKLDLQAKTQSFAAVSILNSINKLEFEWIGLGVSSRNLFQTFILGKILFENYDEKAELLKMKLLKNLEL